MPVAQIVIPWVLTSIWSHNSLASACASGLRELKSGLAAFRDEMWKTITGFYLYCIHLCNISLMAKALANYGCLCNFLLLDDIAGTTATTTLYYCSTVTQLCTLQNYGGRGGGMECVQWNTLFSQAHTWPHETRGPWLHVGGRPAGNVFTST